MLIVRDITFWVVSTYLVHDREIKEEDPVGLSELFSPIVVTTIARIVGVV